MSTPSLLGPWHYRRPPPPTLATASRAAGRAALQLGVLAVVPCALGAQEMRYSLTPTVERLRFDDAIGLDNAYLYGGRLGVLFGRIVELQGFYLTSQGTDARVADLYDRLNVGGQPPQNFGLDLSQYGANLVLNLGTGVFSPYVRGGGSIVRFSPADGAAVERIALQYAGGVRIGRPGSIRLNVFAEDVRFRLDRTLLLALPPTMGGATASDPDAERLRSNRVYGAGLTVPLGGAVGYDDRPSSSLSDLSLPIDAFAGVLNWNDATGLRAQNVAGLRTGIDFGPLVGLRAYYWRGVDGDFSSEGVQSWGAEAQFNLNSGSGLSPFLVGGAGQVDFTGSGVRARGAAGDDDASARLRPADRTALIVGGGVKLPLTDQFSLTAAARNYVTTRDSGRLQDVNATGQLRSSWQYTAGLSFGIGRRPPSVRGAVPVVRRDTVYVDGNGARMALRTDTMPHEVALRGAVRLRDTVTVLVTARGDTLRGAAADSLLDARAADRARVAHADSVTARGAVVAGPPTRLDSSVTTGRVGETSYASERTVAVVVPREGEITVRYGPARATEPAAPAGTDLREEIRAAVRTALREELGADSVDVGPPTRPAALRQRTAAPPPGTAVSPVAMSREDVRSEIRTAIREAMATRDSVRDPVSATPRTTPYGAATFDVAPAPAADWRAEVPAAPAVRTDTTRLLAVPSTATTEMTGVTRSVQQAAEQAARERRVLDSVEARLVERHATDGVANAEARESAPTVTRSTNGGAVREAEGSVELPARRPWSAGGTTLYSGATFSGGRQALLGGRFDFGELWSPVRGLRFVPEVAIGSGSGGTTTLLAANALYQLGGVRVGALGDVRPHASIGLGLLTFSDPIEGRRGTDIVLNPAYGLTFAPPFARPALRVLTLGGVMPALLVEHQGVSLFDVNRLVLGLTWR